MRKVVLFVGVGLMVAAAVVYFIWWYRQAHFAQLVAIYPSSVEAKQDLFEARFAFATMRLASIFLFGLGIVSAVIAYTPWMWQTKEDRG